MKKSKFVKQRAIHNTRRNYSKVENIVTMNSEKLDGIVIKFYYHDTSFKIITFNKEFFFKERGKRLNATQILNNIYAIKHDYGAKYFKII
jgi:hypothetical protein